MRRGTSSSIGWLFTAPAPDFEVHRIEFGTQLRIACLAVGNSAGDLHIDDRAHAAKQ